MCRIPWSMVVLLLWSPYALASRFLQDMAAPPPQQQGPPSPPPSPPPPPPPLYRARLWPFSYDVSHRPPPPTYYLPPPPPKTAVKFSSILVALPVASVVVLFICTYMCSRCKPDRPADRLVANGSSVASTWHVQGDRQSSHGTTQGHADRSYICRLPTLPFSAGKSWMDLHEDVKLHNGGDQKKDRKVDSYNTCSVCISEYEEGEMLKLLPACGHLFHRECIDKWLFSHSTCPLCRLSLFNQNGDLILREERADVDATAPIHQFGDDLEHSKRTSTPSPSICIRSHSWNDHRLPLGILDGIQSHHHVRRDDNRVHPIGSTS